MWDINTSHSTCTKLVKNPCEVHIASPGEMYPYSWLYKYVPLSTIQLFWPVSKEPKWFPITKDGWNSSTCYYVHSVGMHFNPEMQNTILTSKRGKGKGKGRVLPYSLGGGVLLGSQKSYPLVDQMLQILWPFTRLKILCSTVLDFNLLCRIPLNGTLYYM